MTNNTQIPFGALGKAANRFFHYGYNILLGYILWLALVIHLTPSFARYHLKAENEE